VLIVLSTEQKVNARVTITTGVNVIRLFVGEFFSTFFSFSSIHHFHVKKQFLESSVDT